MKIDSFRTFKFTLALVRPITVKGAKLQKRSGLITEFDDEHGHTGLGEVSPLTGLSGEDLKRAESQLSALGYSLQGQQIPENLEELSGGFDRWLERFDLVPSVRFGVETAVLNLIAASRKRPLREVISDYARDDISVNALLAGAPAEILDKASRIQEEGYRAAKLKVGRRSLEEEIELVHEVRRCFNDSVALRLDANRAWGVDEAHRFAHGIDDCAIDYIEEPVHTYEELVSVADDFSLPLALDESLMELQPEQLTALPNLAAIVLKPTVLGFERSMRLARRALSFGITPVVSSAFESGLGLTILAELAACVNISDVPVGLDTGTWYEQDVLARLFRVNKGRVNLGERTICIRDLRRDLLDEVTYE